MREEDDVDPPEEARVDGRLLLVDVEPRAAEVPRLERLDERGLVDDRAARRVDEESLRSSSATSSGRAEPAARRGRERRVDREDVRLREELLEALRRRPLRSTPSVLIPNASPRRATAVPIRPRP